jgi:hypothetical protein
VGSRRLGGVQVTAFGLSIRTDQFPLCPPCLKPLTTQLGDAGSILIRRLSREPGPARPMTSRPSSDVSRWIKQLYSPDLRGACFFKCARGNGHLQRFCTIDDRRMRHEDFQSGSAKQLERAAPGLTMANFQ